MSRSPLLQSPSFLAVALATLLSGGCDGGTDTTGETGGSGTSTNTGGGGTTSTTTEGGGGTTSTTTEGGGGTGGTTSTGGGGTGGTGGSSNACAPQCAANQGITSDCVAITDNTGLDTYGLRMAQFNLSKPAALTNAIVAGLVDDGVTMNLPDCYLTGNGAFSWLLQFDSATGKLKTGGAKPSADPTAGYCFVNEMLGNTLVSPLELDAAPDADGNFTVAMGGDVAVPIFLNTSGSSFIILPLRDVRIVDAKLSADHNCIGKYNSNKLDPAELCEPSGGITRFENAAALDAAITLADADAIPISLLQGQSLCVLLTGEGEGTPPTCKKDPATGKITSKGDWCQATNSPANANCADAFKVTAGLAASAVKITGDCQ